jgi:SAM-dependent methyltransferase
LTLRRAGSRSTRVRHCRARIAAIASRNSSGFLKAVAVDAARCTLAVTMAGSGQAFREFEQAGWERASVVAKYHEHISSVTTQSVEALLDAAGIRSGSRVLDVATGAGYIAGTAAQRGADAIGVDFSAVQVQMARDRYPSVRFEEGDAEALPFDPQSFDAVVSGFGMCHFPNPDIALREAFRVLKAGGRIAFTVWDLPERAVGFGDSLCSNPRPRLAGSRSPGWAEFLSLK